MLLFYCFQFSWLHITSRTRVEHFASPRTFIFRSGRSSGVVACILCPFSFDGVWTLFDNLHQPFIS